MVAESSASPAPTVATTPLPHGSSLYIKCPVLVYHENASLSSSQSETGKTEIKCEARRTVPERAGQVWMDDRRREAARGGCVCTVSPGLLQRAASGICMREFAQEEQIGPPSWSQAQNDKPLPREALKC